MTQNGGRVVELEKRIATLEEQLTQAHLSLILMRGNLPSDSMAFMVNQTRQVNDFEPQEERE